MYRLEISPLADRNLDRLKKRILRHDFERLRTSMSELAYEPRPQGVKKLRGADRVYRIRIGSYRIVYKIHDTEKLGLLLQGVRRTEATYE